jgi:hypothetical protein
MAIPDGSGSEVLKVFVSNVTDATEQLLISGIADHIYSVLSVTVCETGDAAETFEMYVADNGGTTDHHYLKDQALGAKETFVWNERIVISGTDQLIVKCLASCAISITCSYIDQDWTT